jgi:hypothetical protein
MVSKCANPGCTAPFLYLRHGKLFCMETSVPVAKAPGFGADPVVESRSRSVEFYWLCDDCCGSMTVVYTPGIGVKVRQKERIAVAAAL